MANEYSIIIDNYHVKELRCKNDSCRTLIGYDNIRLGVFIFNCPVCNQLSIFNFTYKAQARELMNKIMKRQEGGEK